MPIRLYDKKVSISSNFTNIPNIESANVEMVVMRPSTPEEQKKKCLGCGNMEDFIKGLQGEIQRLQVRIIRSKLYAYVEFNKRPLNVTYFGRGKPSESGS